MLSSFATGVGSNDKDPIAPVRGTEGGSRKAIPFRVVPERGQVCENLSEDGSSADREEVCNVLQEDVSRSNVANDSTHLSPKRSFGMSETLTLSGARGALAREAAGDDVDRLGSSVNCSDVRVHGHSGESHPEQLLSELVDLAEPAVLEPGEVESVGQESAAIEESADTQHPRS